MTAWLYRYRDCFVTAFVALLAGFALHASLTSRYEIIAKSGNSIFRIDRWTGETWVRNQQLWEPVKVEYTPTAKDLEEMSAKLLDWREFMVALKKRSNGGTMMWKELDGWCAVNERGGRVQVDSVFMNIRGDQITEFKSLIASQRTFWDGIDNYLASEIENF